MLNEHTFRKNWLTFFYQKVKAGIYSPRQLSPREFSLKKKISALDEESKYLLAVLFGLFLL